MVKDGSAIPSREINILRVERSYRVVLPQPLLQQAAWVTGDRRHAGWLLLGTSARCRLLSTAEVDGDANLQFLSSRAAAELATEASSLLDFQEETLVSLALRLFPVEITPPKPAWRMTLPKAVAAIMHIRPGESHIAAVVVQKHIEFWTLEALRSALDVPLTEIL